MSVKNGFSLIELMIVIVIIGFLAALSLPTFSKMIAKSKRSEAYVNLHAIYAAQKIYWAEKGTYTMNLYGQDGAGWKPEGYRTGGAQENFYYTYGFGQGTEGINYFTGKLQTSASFLDGAQADSKGFVVYAVGDIDGDGKPDIISINQDNVITIVQDDLID